jgi:hypothetical protein
MSALANCLLSRPLHLRWYEGDILVMSCLSQVFYPFDLIQARNYFKSTQAHPVYLYCGAVSTQSCPDIFYFSSVLPWKFWTVFKWLAFHNHWKAHILIPAQSTYSLWCKNFTIKFQYHCSIFIYFYVTYGYQSLASLNYTTKVIISHGRHSNLYVGWSVLIITAPLRLTVCCLCSKAWITQRDVTR